MRISGNQLEALYRRLYAAYGPQYWWPADSPFEMMVGAILTQNTAWTNVEQALQNLKQSKALHVHAIIELADEKLAALIRPSGYFNIKTKRLKNYARWFVDAGCFRTLKCLDDEVLRRHLLSVNGIGPETADTILLYAFERPLFVIDIYARRLFKKLTLISGDEPYATLRLAFASVLADDVPMLQEYHALIVRHGKEKCSGDATCKHCAVEALISV